MAVGDQTDMRGRLLDALPRGWFPDTAPVLNALLTGIASVMAFCYSLLSYARLQTRIATATDQWLDIISLDLFGTELPRRANETDDAFRARIERNMNVPRNTRAALIEAIENLTGTAPSVFEPANTGDTGGYNLGGVGYGVGGAYGSLELPFQAFVNAYRSATAEGIPFDSGYGSGAGGYGSATAPYANGATAYGNLSYVSGIVTDADIYETIAGVIPVATIAWVAISDGPPFKGPFNYLDVDFVLDQSVMT